MSTASLATMKTNHPIRFSLLIAISLLPRILMAQTQQQQLVRLAVIEVDSTELDRYREFLKEEIDASIQKEPGVITLYCVAEKENPERIKLFETYADSAQYKAHLATPHFQNYKQGTLQMIKHLEVIETQPILHIRKPELSKARSEDLLIRVIQIEINPNTTESFQKLANNVMLPALMKEPDVLVMYAIAEKKRPTHIHILEVSVNTEAYEKHLKTSHFLQYKNELKSMIKTMTRVDVTPILLGAKP
jgi:quinol monooxygenase YgiN